MQGKRPPPEQVIVLFRQAEVELGNTCTSSRVCQKPAISEQTFHRWPNKYGGVKADEMKRLRELENMPGSPSMVSQ